MEIQGGFIVGVYNYCDAWCDRCAFTSRCRVFVDRCEMDAAEDPGLKAIVDAPLLPSEEPPPPPKWLQELLDEMDEAARTPLPDDTRMRREPQLPLVHLEIAARADIYCRRAHVWLKDNDHECGSGDPIAVVSWFHVFIHVKVMRALRGLAEDDPSARTWPADHDGSAKVALIGIDRSQSAWFDLASTGRVSVAEAMPFIEDLLWLAAALEETFPNARAFVRPGFDEPEEVAKLLSAPGE